MLLSAIFVILLVLFFYLHQEIELTKSISIFFCIHLLPFHNGRLLRILYVENTGDRKKVRAIWNFLPEFEAL